jgi:hypothetical protein
MQSAFGLMTAIAEWYGVSGEMELDVQGLTTIHRYEVCEYTTYILYRVETARNLWPQRILRPQFIKPQGSAPVAVVMRYGMREERTTVLHDTTEAEMKTRLIEQVREKADHAWGFRVEDGEHNAQTEFRIAPNWIYPFEKQQQPTEDLRRPTVSAMLKKGPQERAIEVPEGTTEESMKQLLVSGFGADGCKRQRVMALLTTVGSGSAPGLGPTGLGSTDTRAACGRPPQT